MAAPNNLFVNELVGTAASLAVFNKATLRATLLLTSSTFASHFETLVGNKLISVDKLQQTIQAGGFRIKSQPLHCKFDTDYFMVDRSFVRKSAATPKIIYVDFKLIHKMMDVLDANLTSAEIQAVASNFECFLVVKLCREVSNLLAIFCTSRYSNIALGSSLEMAMFGGILHFTSWLPNLTANYKAELSSKWDLCLLKSEDKSGEARLVHSVATILTSTAAAGGGDVHLEGGEVIARDLSGPHSDDEEGDYDDEGNRVTLRF